MWAGSWAAATGAAAPYSRQSHAPSSTFCVKTLLSHHRPNPEVPLLPAATDLTCTTNPLTALAVVDRFLQQYQQQSPWSQPCAAHRQLPPHTPVTTPLYSLCNCSSNTKCFLLPSVYIWAKSSQFSGKMGIKQINYRNSPSIEQLDAAVRTSNSHCRNQQLHKPDPSRKGLCCAAGVYNLCITNIITSMTLGGSYLFVCKNSSEAFKGVSFTLSSTVFIILGP